jgi:hypothetical protein
MITALCIQWAKTRALGLRNTEEVDLLEEEMRRTPVFLRWRAGWWDSKKMRTEGNHPDLELDAAQREGHDAYATRQAQILRRIASRFEQQWSDVPALIRKARDEVDSAERGAWVETRAESAESNEGDEEEHSSGGHETSESSGEEE